MVLEATGSALVEVWLEGEPPRLLPRTFILTEEARRLLGVPATADRLNWEDVAGPIHAEDRPKVEQFLAHPEPVKGVRFRIRRGEEPSRWIGLWLSAPEALEAGVAAMPGWRRWAVLHDLEKETTATKAVAMFQAFMDHLPAMAVVKNAEDRYVFVNRTLQRFLGLRGDPEEYKNKTPAELFRDEELVRLIEETDEAVLQSGQPLLREATVNIGGHPRHFVMSKFPIQLPEGGRWLGVVTLETTALRQAEAALAESQRRLDTLVNNLPGAVYRCHNDEAWTMLYLSEAIRDITGYPPEDFLHNRRRSYASIVHPEDLPQVRRAVATAVALDEPFTLEYRILHADGRPRWVWERGRPVMIQGKLLLEGFITDVSERRQAEEENRLLEHHIRNQQRLEAIGQLAGGVAHEINNPITGIINYSEILEESLPPDSPLREFTREIRHESERIAKLIRTLLAFARPEKRSFQSTPLRLLIEQALSLVRTDLKQDFVKVFTEIPSQPLTPTCRPDQIQQLILNLLSNAREALNECYPGHHPGKALWIRASGFEREGQPWVRIEVEDHGTGVPGSDSADVFNPFFTTKNRSRHAGLGLTVAQSIVNEHGGRIRMESQPGRFTRVVVELPSRPPGASPSEPSAPGNTEGNNQDAAEAGRDRPD